MKLTTKKTLAITIGNAFEYYDFMLYGFFATLLAPLFFPYDSPALSLIASMGSYGVGFLARPLGGIVFGHMGDRWGRKNTLSLSLLGVTLPTLGIGLLPTYAQIGVGAPLLLITCRLLQGFCLGGESSGAMTYLIENTPATQRDKVSAWLVTSCYGGTLLGTLLGSAFTLSCMPPWGWRLTFITGSLIALIGYYIRKNLKESPEFIDLQKKGQILKVLLETLFTTEKLSLFFTASLASAVIVPFFIIFIYLNGLLIKDLHMTTHYVFLFNAGLMGFWMCLLPLFGALAQSYGRKRVMTLGICGMGGLSLPLFLMMGPQPTLSSLLITQLVLSVFASAYAAPTSAFLVDLFPANQRYSGIAFGYSLGHAIFGGLTPLVLTTLQSLGFYLAPVACLGGSCFLGLIAVHEGFFIFYGQKPRLTSP